MSLWFECLLYVHDAGEEYLGSHPNFESQSVIKMTCARMRDFVQFKSKASSDFRALQLFGLNMTANPHSRCNKKIPFVRRFHFKFQNPKKETVLL
jgi:hypothetical protein